MSTQANAKMEVAMQVQKEIPFGLDSSCHAKEAGVAMQLKERDHWKNNSCHVGLMAVAHVAS